NGRFRRLKSVLGIGRVVSLRGQAEISNPLLIELAVGVLVSQYQRVGRVKRVIEPRAETRARLRGGNSLIHGLRIEERIERGRQNKCVLRDIPPIEIESERGFRFLQRTAQIEPEKFLIVRRQRRRGEQGTA